MHGSHENTQTQLDGFCTIMVRAAFSIHRQQHMTNEKNNRQDMGKDAEIWWARLQRQI